MQSDCLDFRKLPGQNPIFLDHLFNFERVSGLFHAPPVDRDSMQERARGVLSRYRYPRQELVSALREFNQAAGGGTATAKMLDMLAREDVVAVISGQQVGLFGGPAYTLYKSATAIRLAAWLRENDVPAVPVFWLAADDSDFEEVRSASFITRQAELHTIRHADSRPHKETMAGSAPVQLENELDHLERALSGHPHAGETVELLRRCYRPGLSFCQAFAQLLSSIFKDQGLILFDSRERGVRSRTGGFFSAAVLQRETIVQRLLRRGKELEELGFTPQVAVDETETLLFYLQGSERYKLKFEHGQFRAKERNNLRFSTEQLAEEARSRPENFGFNALLRPILQDSIFPTAIYVGGPAEVAYFAQVNAIAPIWEIQPVIQPRASFTLVDPKSQRLLEKYNLRCEQILTASDQDLAEKILNQGEQEEVLKLFGALDVSVQKQIETLSRHLRDIDPPLADMLGNARSKIGYQIDKVRQRFVSNQKSRQPFLKDHLSHLLNRMRPEDKPQERYFTSTQFLAEEGPSLIGRLIEQISPDCPSHRIWKL